MGRVWLLVLAWLLVGCDHPVAPIVDASPSPIVKPKYLYSVQQGDTLYSIAFIANSDVAEIARLNNINEPYTIYVGQVIALHPSAVGKITAESSSDGGFAKTAPPVPAPQSTNNTGNTSDQKRQQPAKSDAASSSKERIAATPPRAQPIPKPSASNAKANKGWVWPVRGEIITKYSTASKGIDIAGKSGAPIAASRSGVVVYTGNAIRGSGNMVIVKHDERYLTAYAHLKEIKVKEGQQVRQSDTIGTLGRSDASSDRLHFEVRDRGEPVNPLKFLKS